MEVEVIKHSVARNSGIELKTIRARYWRPIHSEVMTHRKFGRNARSSRAVPNKVLLREPIVEPLFYGSNRPGMSSGDELKGWRYLLARSVWLTLAHTCRGGVWLMNWAGLHKQWSNRPLEWFGSIDVLITATDWRNWEALRDHPAAAPEIRQLAIGITQALSRSTPQVLGPGEWHLPYVTKAEMRDYDLETCQKLSVARCARLSYKPFDGSDMIEDEFARFDRLVGSRPVHASPAEHQATPDTFDMHETGKVLWDNADLHGNLRGWNQYRKMLPNECVPEKEHGLAETPQY